MDNQVVKDAAEGRYSAFSKAIKQELHNKMSNSDAGKEYSSAFDKIQHMKQMFSKINTEKPETEE
jgi:hypothetical protein